MNGFTEAVSERCYGVEVTGSQTLVVAEVVDGRPSVIGRYTADDIGVQALTRHIAGGRVHSRICIRTCGGLALSVACALMAVPRGEVMMLADHALQRPPSPGGTVPQTPEARAERLAVLAKRML